MTARKDEAQDEKREATSWHLRPRQQKVRDEERAQGQHLPSV